jgi:ParB-like chromosome segregation protein Spo0J
MIESEYKIYKTKEYNKFKILKGNRTIPRNRVEKIKQSIEEVGCIINPIIVNENYEIIDGQGRFTALQESDKDIYYIIA